MYLTTIAESYVQINCSLSLSVSLSLSATGGCETSKELPPPPPPGNSQTSLRHVVLVNLKQMRQHLRILINHVTMMNPIRQTLTNCLTPEH